jgi:phage major head subunit gpT-like protein
MPQIPVATGLAGVQALWVEKYQPLVGADGLLAIPNVADLAMLVPSNVTQEVYAALSAAPGLSEHEGELIIASLVAGKLELVVKDYDAALGIPRNDFDDDRIGLHRARVIDMSAKATWHPTKLIAQTLEANPKAFDGTALFADSRTKSVLADIDNSLAPAMVSDTVPTDIEMETAVKAAISALRSFTDDQGDPIALGAEFGVLVPTALAWQALACANDQTIGPAGSLKVNSVRGQFTPGVNPFLTSDLTMYTYIRNRATKPLFIQERQAVQIETLGEGSDEWVKNKRAVFKASARRACAVAHPVFIVKSLFTHT